ncbi:MAG: DUF7065 domain-containing protein [Chloroflexota bacterium]
MAITPWDEYLIHQIPDTVDVVVGGDPHWMDRFFFGCHSADGTLHLMAGLGTYPNVNVMDGFVCVRHNNRQRNIRLSRHLENDRADARIGPLSFEVLAPLTRWGVYLNDNDHDIGCSIEFHGRVPPYLFPKIGGGDTEAPAQVHYNQPGRYTGTISFEGQQFDAGGFLGARDRSWGVRRPGSFAALDIYFWIQAQFTTCSLSLLYVELLNGEARVSMGGILNDDGSAMPIAETRHRIDFSSQLRTYSTVEMQLVDANGRERHVVARPLSPGSYMNGGGYDDRHGVDRGAFHVEGEAWDVSQPVALDSPLYGLHQRDAEFQLDGEPGIGLIEASFTKNEAWQYKPTW